MSFRLMAFGQSFATRERAAEILPVLSPDSQNRVVIDFDGTVCSTSFLIGLIGSLINQARTVVVQADEALMQRIKNLAEKYQWANVAFESPNAIAAS